MGKKAANLPTGQSQYQVVGRFVPNAKYSEDNPQCKVYRMNLFAKNKVVARSRFWYFMGRLCRVKKANGQIISVSQVRRRRPAARRGERSPCQQQASPLVRPRAAANLPPQCAHHQLSPRVSVRGLLPRQRLPAPLVLCVAWMVAVAAALTAAGDAGCGPARRSTRRAPPR